MIYILLLFSALLKASPYVPHIEQDETSVAITMEENASTGSLWYLKNWDAQLLEPSSTKVLKHESKLLGAPYHRTFVFNINRSIIKVPIVTNMVLVKLSPSGEQLDKKEFSIKFGVKS